MHVVHIYACLCVCDRCHVYPTEHTFPFPRLDRIMQKKQPPDYSAAACNTSKSPQTFPAFIHQRPWVLLFPPKLLIPLVLSCPVTLRSFRFCQWHTSPLWKIQAKPPLFYVNLFPFEGYVGDFMIRFYKKNIWVWSLKKKERATKKAPHKAFSK